MMPFHNYLFYEKATAMIFEEFRRTNWKHQQHGETSFQFINHSAWPIAGIGRSILNHWATQLPADNEFISKIKSTSDRQHDAAVFELLFFAIAKSNGLPIQRIPAGVQKTPDFRIGQDNGQSFFECTLVSNAMYQESVTKKISAVNQMIDDIKKLSFFVSVNYDEVGLDDLPKKKFTQFLMAMVAQINGGLLPGQSLHDIPFTHDDWELNIALHRKEEPEERNLGGYTRPPHPVDNFKPLYASLRRKSASNYALVQSPYVICLGVDDLSAHDDEFTRVLFGLEKASRGFFVHRGKPMNTSVSAVFFCEYLKIFGLPSTRITCYHNPYALYPLQQGLFPIEDHHFTINGHYLRRKVTGIPISALDVLKIDKEAYFDGMLLENKTAPVR